MAKLKDYSDKHLGKHVLIPGDGMYSNFSGLMLFSYQVSQVILQCQNETAIFSFQTAADDLSQSL